jgi:endoglucanase
MKKTKKLLVMACTVALTIVNTPALTVKADTVDNESPKPVPQTPSTQYAAAMYPGTNLGNTFDAINSWDRVYADETIWGNPRVTKDQIDAIAAEGFKSLRIPLTVETRLGPAPTYTIDPDFLGRYEQVVQWAVEDGLYVTVNTHHDSDWLRYYEADDDNGETKAKFEAVWTQLANTFKDYDSKVSFESTNELMPQNHSGEIYNQWGTEAEKAEKAPIVNQRMADLNKHFHQIVRATGGNNATRMLIMPPIWHNSSPQWTEPLAKTILDLNDPNIMGAFHGYAAWFYDQGIGGYDSFNELAKADVRNYVDNAYNALVSKGIGVVQNETWAGNEYSEPGERLQYFEYINYYSHIVSGITPMYWDAGQALDRINLTWKEPKLMAALKGAWAGRNSYTASDRVFIKDQDKNSDADIPVILNGNTLNSIYNGTTKLVEGQDYTYANSTVTLKGSYVSSLMTDGYGTKATLTFKFSAGADWDTDLIRYATPVVGSVTGSTSNFVIPVQFNGSKLRSLEAVQVDGSYPHVGEFSWSNYKPFEAYKVDYTANTITMTDKFFNQEYDKTLPQFVIKLHFQSGEVQDLLINQADGQLTYTAPVVTTIAIDPTTPNGNDGWYTSGVTISLTTNDNSSMTEYSLDGSTTWQTYTAPFTLDKDGQYTVSYRSIDNSGNVETVKSISFKLDLTGPTITAAGVVSGTYNDSTDITPVITLDDQFSGVDTSKTTITLDGKDVQQGATIQLYKLPLGSHTLIVTASDLAGNISTKEIVFQTTASIQSLMDMVTSFMNAGWIDNAGIASSLQSKLNSNALTALVNEVKAQSGKHISAEAADLLIRDAQYLLSQATGQ